MFVSTGCQVASEGSADLTLKLKRDECERSGEPTFRMSKIRKISKMRHPHHTLGGCISLHILKSIYFAYFKSLICSLVPLITFAFHL